MITDIIQEAYSFWFLWALLLSSILVFIIEHAKPRTLLYLLSVLTFLFLPNTLNFPSYGYIYSFVILGIELHRHIGVIKHAIQSICIQKQVFLAGVLIFTFVALVFLYDRNSYIYFSGMSILSNESILKQIMIDGYREIIGVLGCITSYILVKCMSISDMRKKFLNKILFVVGQETLGAYIIDRYFHVYVLQRITSSLSPSLLFWLLETIICIFIYHCLIKLISYNKFLSILLLGKINK